MKKFLAGLFALILLFSPAIPNAQIPPQCSAEVKGVYETNVPNLVAEKLRIDCDNPHGYRIYLTRMGQFHRDLQIGDGPIHKDYFAVVTKFESTFDRFVIEKLK